MLDLSVQIETEISELKFMHLKKYWKEDQPKYWLFLHENGEIYRSKKNKDGSETIPAFRKQSLQKSFAKSDKFEEKSVYPLRCEFEDIIVHCTPETLIALDPWWEGCSLSYDQFFIVKLKSSQSDDK